MVRGVAAGHGAFAADMEGAVVQLQGGPCSRGAHLSSVSQHRKVVDPI
jgi:hypothetical protein